jgi:hypothetical protein
MVEEFLGGSDELDMAFLTHFRIDCESFIKIGYDCGDPIQALSLLL